MNENYFKQFENNIEKLKKDDEGNVKFSLLDFFPEVFRPNMLHILDVLYKKKIRKLLNKKLRKMDFENPKYINYYYA